MSNILEIYIDIFLIWGFANWWASKFRQRRVQQPGNYTKRSLG